MTMTPDRFRRLLDQGTADAPPAPPTTTDLEAGRARLRRRRVTSVAAAALAVVVVAGGVGVANRVGTDDRGLDPITPPSTPTSRAVDPTPDPPRGINAAAVLRDCGADDLPPGYFDGEESVPVARATSYQVVATIQSADGRYWAACTILLGDSEDIPTPVLYDSHVLGDAAHQGLEMALGSGCTPATTSCLYYALSLVDRLPAEVAAVRIELDDGTTATEPTTRGFYVINLLQRLPEGSSVDDHGRLVGISGLDFVHQVTYLDAAGTPLAAERFDFSGGGQSGGEVDGLPALSIYPSLRGDL
jgi:hypothetical protein